MEKVDVKDFYVSPLGRAKDTASFTLKKKNADAEVCPWLEEFFTCQIKRPDLSGGKTIAWDWLPEDFVKYPELYDRYNWKKNEIMMEGGVPERYDWVAENLDALLAKYGYVREGDLYHVEQGNNDTIAFFCHFGVESVLLSHLLNIAPMVLWQNMCALPTSVTTVVTEERRKGTASMRVIGFGDLSHLYAEGIEPSFAARFRECYENDWERLD